MERFSEMNRKIHINLFVEHAGKYYQFWRTEDVDDPDHFVNLLYTEGTNARDGEIEGHFFVVSNISKFTQKYFLCKDGRKVIVQ